LSTEQTEGDSNGHNQGASREGDGERIDSRFARGARLGGTFGQRKVAARERECKDIVVDAGSRSPSESAFT